VPPVVATATATAPAAPSDSTVRPRLVTVGASS
jgi:hypothetical protein